jgi:nitrous oxidase accessory protein NosD
MLDKQIANNGYDVGNNKQWDDGGFGNYWSDYTGKDTNTEGIGDTPYIAPKNGIDNRPMINPRK